MNYLKSLPNNIKKIIKKRNKNENESDAEILDKILEKVPKKKIKKIKIRNKKKEKKLLKQYIEARKELKNIQDAIKEERDFSKKEKLKEKEKKQLEKIDKLQENFYDIDRGIWLGIAGDLEDEDADIFLLYLDWKNIINHFSVYGISGYGKSRLFAIILKQMIAKGWSVFAVDPKGGENREIANWFYEFAIQYKRNNNVIKIMASYPNESDKLNPIFGMSDEEIANFCKSLTVTGVSAESSDEKYFTGQVYKIAFAICSATRFLEKCVYSGEEGRKILNEKILREAEKYIAFKNNDNNTDFYENEEYIFPDAARVANSPAQSVNDENIDIDPYNRTLITFRELAYFGEYDNLKDLYDRVDTAPLPSIKADTQEGKKILYELNELKNIALQTLKPLINMDKDKYNAVGNTFSILMNQLAYGPIGKIFCTIRVNPLRFRLKNKKGVLVLFEPAPMRFELISEIMMKVFLKMFLSLFGKVRATEKKINRRVALMIDETKPMMYPGIDELYNKTRQLGITIGAFSQSKNDLKNKIKTFFQSKGDSKNKAEETLTSIIDDNIATQIFMKQISASFQEEIAKSFGTKKFAVNVYMGDVDMPGGKTTIIHEERPLLLPTHIDSLQIGEAVMKHYGKKYFIKFPIQKDAQDVADIELDPLESEIVFEQYSKAEATVRSNLFEIDRINVEFEKNGL